MNKASIIVPIYYGERFIAKAIRWILTLTDRAVELLGVGREAWQFASERLLPKRITLPAAAQQVLSHGVLSHGTLSRGVHQQGSKRV